jgi:hypothetical protein
MRGAGQYVMIAQPWGAVAAWIMIGQPGHRCGSLGGPIALTSFETQTNLHTYTGSGSEPEISASKLHLLSTSTC